MLSLFLRLYFSSKLVPCEEENRQLHGEHRNPAGKASPCGSINANQRAEKEAEADTENYLRGCGNNGDFYVAGSAEICLDSVCCRREEIKARHQEKIMLAERDYVRLAFSREKRNQLLPENHHEDNCKENVNPFERESF